MAAIRGEGFMPPEDTPAQLFGPAVGEGPARRYGPVDRVAVLSDVHANVAALTAVLAEAEAWQPDLVVFNGDLTWGSEPTKTIDIVRRLDARAVFVRGNAERAVLELVGGTRRPNRPRESWMAEQHGTVADFVATFAFSAVVDIRGLGPVRFCHGSPRSDTELITPRTSEQRFRQLMTGVAERTLVTGHTHLQFDRPVAGWRSINPGSVGLPYHDGAPGTAYWAMLGPDVHLRQTHYDIAETLQIGPAVGDPGAETINSLLLRPPASEEVMTDAESRVFAD
jgi:predicted phosphodiesterase